MWPAPWCLAPACCHRNRYIPEGQNLAADQVLQYAVDFEQCKTSFRCTNVLPTQATYWEDTRTVRAHTDLPNTCVVELGITISPADMSVMHLARCGRCSVCTRGWGCVTCMYLHFKRRVAHFWMELHNELGLFWNWLTAIKWAPCDCDFYFEIGVLSISLALSNTMIWAW